jgi:ribose 5-phosphate isomerase B
VDYPDIAVQVARKVAAGDCERGIMIDGAGTGSGIAIVTRSSAKY